ncbi:hypothetical protein CMU70_18485 [Elizabethkingia anophelis]|nr:hypothetical protein [Elizabethkingia anophelis]MDV3837651.1 hypothetical protein [Elizabethkingia anophelis]
MKSFFELPTFEELRLSTIKNFDVDRFKSLNNFLKGNTHVTADKNIELLAWLIGFPRRPYFSYEYFIKKTQRDLSTFIVLESGDFSKSLSRSAAIHEYPIDFDAPSIPNSADELDVYSAERITLEYPNGVKISLATSNINFIAQLVKLG